MDETVLYVMRGTAAHANYVTALIALSRSRDRLMRATSGTALLRVTSLGIVCWLSHWLAQQTHGPIVSSIALASLLMITVWVILIHAIGLRFLFWRYVAIMRRDQLQTPPPLDPGEVRELNLAEINQLKRLNGVLSSLARVEHLETCIDTLEDTFEHPPLARWSRLQELREIMLREKIRIHMSSV